MSDVSLRVGASRDRRRAVVTRGDLPLHRSFPHTGLHLSALLFTFVSIDSGLCTGSLFPCHDNILGKKLQIQNSTVQKTNIVLSSFWIHDVMSGWSVGLLARDKTGKSSGNTPRKQERGTARQRKVGKKEGAGEWWKESPTVQKGKH